MAGKGGGDTILRHGHSRITLSQSISRRWHECLLGRSILELN